MQRKVSGLQYADYDTTTHLTNKKDFFQEIIQERKFSCQLRILFKLKELGLE